MHSIISPAYDKCIVLSYRVVVVDVSRLAGDKAEPSVHEGSECQCMSLMPDKYRQVLAAQSECYTDIPELLLAADLCYNYVVREFLCLFTLIHEIFQKFMFVSDY